MKLNLRRNSMESRTNLRRFYMKIDPKWVEEVAELAHEPALRHHMQLTRMWQRISSSLLLVLYEGVILMVKYLVSFIHWSYIGDKQYGPVWGLFGKLFIEIWDCVEILNDPCTLWNYNLVGKDAWPQGLSLVVLLGAQSRLPVRHRSEMPLLSSIDTININQFRTQWKRVLLL